MKLRKFRIKNFKSIVDTEWISFSPDQVTVLIGQNESGKSSILEALSKTFSPSELLHTDIRAGEDLPEIYLEYQASEAHIRKILEPYNKDETSHLIGYLKSKDFILTSYFYWEANEETDGFTGRHDILEDDIGDIFNLTKPSSVLTSSSTDSTEPPPGHDYFPFILYLNTSKFHLFDHETGLLPSTIDIPDNFKLADRGHSAATSYLTYADIDLKKLLSQELRAQKSILHKANERISKEFSSFWTQTIGHENKIKFECSLEKHDTKIPEKAGKPYLAFFISDGLNRLYPSQRSTGVRWFLSFFLQIKSSEKNGADRVFLLDEPGSNLHSKAQKDVLNLINKLSKTITIVYSTHSPSLIEYEKLYRIHAVFRTDDLDDSPTQVTEAYKLGSSSSDTLSPLMSAMGSDFSQQQVIKKDRNIILEEISGYYYFKSFWKLTNEASEANFIAATGVNKIEPLAYMFTGWGLDFIVAIDDDNQARGVYNSLKKNLYLDDEKLAKKKMLKIPNCQGIEDIFTRSDFAKFVIHDEIQKIKTSNSDHMKKSTISKPITALKFLLSVENNEITINMLEKQTVENIENLILQINQRLND